MANEITAISRLSLTNGNYKEDTQLIQSAITQAAIGAAGGIQVIGTSEEVITSTDVGTLGWAWFRNLDTSNYVTIGPESGGAMVGMLKLKAGETAGPFRLLPGVVLRGQANGASVKLKKLILED